MRLLVQTFIPGHARTKGSLDVKHYGRGRRPVLVDTDLSIMWRRLVAYKARLDYAARWPDAGPCLGPIRVEGLFILPGATWEVIMAQGAGDVDKLLRNTLDALATDPHKPDLSAGVYGNDSQVVTSAADKMPDFQVPGKRGLHLHVFEVTQ